MTGIVSLMLDIHTSDSVLNTSTSFSKTKWTRRHTLATMSNTSTGKLPLPVSPSVRHRLTSQFAPRIHMLPLLPYSALTRPSRFVFEEWSLLFDPANATAPAPASTVQGGWKGILYANLALIDPKRSWEFFAQRDFDMRWIDGGASRTWYLAWAAGEFAPDGKFPGCSYVDCPC